MTTYQVTGDEWIKIDHLDKYSVWIVVCEDLNGDNPNMYFGPFYDLEKAKEFEDYQNASYWEDNGEPIGCPNEHYVMGLHYPGYEFVSDLDVEKRS